MTKPLFTVSLTAAAVVVLLTTGCAQPSSDRTESQSSSMQRSADPAMGRVASQDQRTAEMDGNPTPGQSPTPTPAPSTTTAGNTTGAMADASGAARTDIRVTPGALDNGPSAAPSGEIGTHPATGSPATPNAGTMPSSSDTMSPSASNTGTTLPASDGRNSNTDAYRSGPTTDSSSQRGSSAMAGSGTAEPASPASAYGDNESTMRSARTDRN